MQLVGAAVTLAVVACSGGGRPAAPEGVISPPARMWSADALADLRAAADGAPTHGLPSEDEAISDLERLEPLSLRDAVAAQAVDAAADALFERLALSFATGAVDPGAVDPDWAIPRAPAPDLAAVREAIAAGARPSTLLNALLPTAADYAALVAELARVQAEEIVPSENATLSRQGRIDQLRVNLERWRWLPRTLPPRRLEVIVPLFELRVREGDVSMTHAVIVGARRSQTPTFSASIESITLNPTWTPPPSIANAELLPRFRRDPSAAAREGFQVIDRAGQVVDPAEVDWGARPFPYSLRQQSGANNALGRVRFNMPNAYAVYLHDTPSRSLFERIDRALSHGCIRVANPVGLAARILADEAFDENALARAIESGDTSVQTLREPLPIYVLYLTAVSDGAAGVRYAEDVYRRDRAVLRALQRADDGGAVVSSAQGSSTHCVQRGA